jgi:hypothetical protein
MNCNIDMLTVLTRKVQNMQSGIRPNDFDTKQVHCIPEHVH